MGFAERVRAEHGVPVSVHELDAALTGGEVPNPSPGLGRVRWPSMLGFLLWGMRRGALRTKAVTEVSTFGSGATLDVPGALQVIATQATPRAIRRSWRQASAPSSPRHAFHVPGHQRGDRPARGGLQRGSGGGARLPERIEAVEADWLLPGHGAPWRDGVAAAVEVARQNGIGHLAPRR